MKVLVVEDDKEIVEVLTMVFSMRWPDAKLVSTNMGEKGVELVESESPDVVILDLGLPDISGFDVLKQIRAFSGVPVMILTVRGEESDIVKGLEWGADDYMVKPFRQMELMSRIQALTRRTGPTMEGQPLTCGQLRFMPRTKQLYNGDAEIKITPTEGSILECLMKSKGQVVTYTDLAEGVWGENFPDPVESLRVYIRRLRQKIEDDPEKPKYILNHSGIGYSLATDS
jgi:two-component system, OmpR family, response regulator VicR